MDTAKDWLLAAEVTSKAGISGQSLFSLEMSVEIALKAVLLSVNADVPKVHDIRSVINVHLKNNSVLPKKFLENLPGYMKVFEELIRERAPAGYGFESMERGEFKAQMKELMPKCREIVRACDAAIKHVEGKR